MWRGAIWPPTTMWSTRRPRAARLTLPDASVDAALANMYLHHCTDPAAAIREMARIVRPGGRLVITDMDRHEHEWMRAEMADEWLGFERAQVKQWLRDAGLVNVLVDCSNQSCCATSTGRRRTNRAEISVFVATGTRPVAGSRAAVQANYGALAEATLNWERPFLLLRVERGADRVDG